MRAEELGRARPKQVSKLFLVLSCSLFLSFSHIQEERLKTLELAKSHLKEKKKRANYNATTSQPH
jgi:hypothetical protein